MKDNDLTGAQFLQRASNLSETSFDHKTITDNHFIKLEKLDLDGLPGLVDAFFSPLSTTYDWIQKNLKDTGMLKNKKHNALNKLDTAICKKIVSEIIEQLRKKELPIFIAGQPINNEQRLVVLVQLLEHPLFLLDCCPRASTAVGMWGRSSIQPLAQASLTTLQQSLYCYLEEVRQALTLEQSSACQNNSNRS